MTVYQDELREIRKKSRQVYNKRGIYPFLDDGDEYCSFGEYMPGFQVFSILGDILDDVDLDEE